MLWRSEGGRSRGGSVKNTIISTERKNKRRSSGGKQTGLKARAGSQLRTRDLGQVNTEQWGCCSMGTRNWECAHGAAIQPSPGLLLSLQISHQLLVSCFKQAEQFHGIHPLLNKTNTHCCSNRQHKKSQGTEQHVSPAFFPTRSERRERKAEPTFPAIR